MKLLLFLSILFSSCGSYNLTRRVNPFKKYGVRSVSVPMFYNQTNLSNATHHFTRYFTHLLYELKDIQVKEASSNDVDAYLVGILRSPYKLSRTLVGTAPVDVGSESGAPVGVTNQITGSTRSALIPTVTKLNLTLDIYLIRKTAKSKGMVYMIREKSFPELAENNDAIILKQTFLIQRNYEREIFDKVKDGSNNVTVDNTVINGTQNRGILEKTLIAEAQKAANNFRNIILYAF